MGPKVKMKTKAKAPAKAAPKSKITLRRPMPEGKVSRRVGNKKFQCAGPGEWSALLQRIARRALGATAREADGVRLALHAGIVQLAADLDEPKGFSDDDAQLSLIPILHRGNGVS